MKNKSTQTDKEEFECNACKTVLMVSKGNYIQIKGTSVIPKWKCTHTALIKTECRRRSEYKSLKATGKVKTITYSYRWI